MNVDLLLDAVKDYFTGFAFEVIDPHGVPRTAGRPRMAASFRDARLLRSGVTLVLEIDMIANNGEKFTIKLSEESLVPARENDPHFSLEQLIAEQLVFSVQESICFSAPVQLNGKVIF